MARGGARPNAGRKPGSESAVTKERRALVQRVEAGLAKKGMTPLEIFSRVMGGDLSVSEMQFEAAKAAAPYLHPKLSAVTMNATVKRSVTDFTDDELEAIAGSDEEGGEGCED